MTSSLNVVILAAGKGTRMYSETPKVLHELAGRSLVEHVINTAEKLGPTGVTLVIGHQANLIQDRLANRSLKFALQREQKGTAHAVEQAIPMLDDEAMVLVLYGDVPMISEASLQLLLDETDANSMAVLTCKVSDPTGLGRIIRDKMGEVAAIIEDKDASPEQKQINEINTGIMAFPASKLKQWLPQIKANNAQKEYYLTDIVKLAIENKCQVNSVSCFDEVEASGINNMLQLATLERHYQAKQAKSFLLRGLKMMDPARFDCRGELEFGADVCLDINVIVEGSVKIGKGVHIGPNCVLKNCEIGAGTQIQANSIIEDSLIGKDCSIGPFARIRPGSELSDQAKIGNFVETKKAKIGKGSKVNHLSYIGDTEMGESVNVGAGTITCNYDGVNKFRTVIGDNVFVGSNTALVAPVSVADGATIGAGSTITKNVDTDQLALSRSKQTNINGWERPTKK